eukprot:12013524-Alexandrium_andersonii.AAC.1
MTKCFGRAPPSSLPITTGAVKNRLRGTLLLEGVSSSGYIGKALPDDPVSGSIQILPSCSYTVVR